MADRGALWVVGDEKQREASMKRTTISVVITNVGSAVGVRLLLPVLMKAYGNNRLLKMTAD